MSAYVPLWCKSNSSFLEGASHPEELVEQAHHLGLRALALTDRDGVYGIVRAHEKARELGVKLLIGAQVSVADGAEVTGGDGASVPDGTGGTDGAGEDACSQVVLLAEDRDGYANLCRLLSAGRLR